MPNETNNAAPQQEKVVEAGRMSGGQPIKKSAEKATDTGLHIHFKAVLNGLIIGASILPSLKAQHKVDGLAFSSNSDFFAICFTLHTYR